MNPKLIPHFAAQGQRCWKCRTSTLSDHEPRTGAVLELFPRDELFQSSVQDLYDTVTAVNRIQERRQTRLFVRRDVHGKFVNCMVYIPATATPPSSARKSSASCATPSRRGGGVHHAFFRIHPGALPFRAAGRSQGVAELTPARSRTRSCRPPLAWEDRLRLRLMEEFGEEQGEVFVLRELADRFPRVIATTSIPGWRC